MKSVATEVDFLQNEWQYYVGLVGHFRARLPGVQGELKLFFLQLSKLKLSLKLNEKNLTSTNYSIRLWSYRVPVFLP